MFQRVYALFMPLTAARETVLIQHQLSKMYGPDSYYTIRYMKEELMYCGQCLYWLAARLKTFKDAEVTSRPQVLDIGPGYGTLAALASVYGAEVTTLDKCGFMSAEVAAKFGVIQYVGDAERCPLPKATTGVGFDCIVLTEVLEHFNFHPLPTLKKLRYALKSGGILLLSTPDAASWGRVTIYPSLDAIPIYNQQDPATWRDEHIWQYTQKELLDTLESAGFKLEQFAHSHSPGGNHFNLQMGVR